MLSTKRRLPLLGRNHREPWFEALYEVLHQGGCIHQDVAVAGVQAERLTSDSTGMEDGGGLSEAVMIRIQVEYRYDIRN